MVLTLAGFSLSCGGNGSTAPSFNGLLAMSMHNGGVDDTDAKYIEDYDLAQTIGVNAAQVLIPWNLFEPTAGVYQPGFFTSAGWGLDALSARGLKILFTFPVFDITSKTVPDDLLGLPLNHPTMTSRYRNAIDQILPYLNSDVIYFSVGNEVDFYLAANPAEWAPYKALVDDAINHIHSVRPDMKVGVTTTFQNSIVEAANIATLNTNTDIHIMTYYLTDSALMVRGPPDTILADLDTMVAQAAGKPLVLQEIGYPSSTINGGSEAGQAEFVEHVFARWQSIGAEKLPFLSFFKRKDWNTDFCTTVTGGQTSGGLFWEFMCSLGFTNNDLSPKPAWTTLIDQIQASNLQ
jgi:hypothetical protein